MELGIAGKVVFFTGGSKGMGRLTGGRSRGRHLRLGRGAK